MTDKIEVMLRRVFMALRKEYGSWGNVAKEIGLKGRYAIERVEYNYGQLPFKVIMRAISLAHNIALSQLKSPTDEKINDNLTHNDSAESAERAKRIVARARQYYGFNSNQDL